MNDQDIRFLDELRAEFRRVAQAQAPATAQKSRLRRPWRLVSVPGLAAIAILIYVLSSVGGPVAAKVPVVNFSGQSNTAPAALTIGTKAIGNQTCIRAGDGKLPPLIRSDATPDQALMSELSMLRSRTTPLDSISLGKWDRYPLLIETVFERYARVYNAAEHVQIAFVPVTYCTQSQDEPSGPSDPGGVVRETLEQGLVMLVLSNHGEHPPVLVGTAQQIKSGPALAGLDISNAQGFERAWLQTIVVPDGVARVAMEFTAPYRYPRTVSLDTTNNVGIDVRKYPDTPTIVYWYGPNGRLLKKFVDRKALAFHNCQAAHKKGCFQKVYEPGQGHKAPTATFQIAANQTQSGPPDLIAQANQLYQPVATYKASVTTAQTNDADAAKAHVTQEINACDRPYGRQLFQVIAGTRKYKLYMLWDAVSTMQDYEADVEAYAPQLRTLTASWTALSLASPQMNEFAHATAAEIEDTLNAPPMNTCAFVNQLAAHHFSYQWAKNSTDAVEAASWQQQTLQDGNQTSAFWRYVQAPIFYSHTKVVYRAGGLGWKLFTQAQTRALANLPGEVG